MRLYKFLLTVIFITAFSLLYTYQQAEIFRFAYIGQKKQAFFEDLLDKNSILRYTKESNASLVHIGTRVCENADFQMPDTYRLVKLTPSIRGLRPGQRPLNRETVLSRLFGIKRQAEARTINP